MPFQFLVSRSRVRCVFEGRKIGPGRGRQPRDRKPEGTGWGLHRSGTSPSGHVTSSHPSLAAARCQASTALSTQRSPQLVLPSTQPTPTRGEWSRPVPCQPVFSLTLKQLALALILWLCPSPPSIPSVGCH